MLRLPSTEIPSMFFCNLSVICEIQIDPLNFLMFTRYSYGL